ncbi:MAG: YdcF family protein [bacterium]|nr:YdcF family protein [bacterium]
MRWRGWAAGTAVLVGLALLAMRGAGTFLVVADPLPARADVIVVLAGSVPDRALEAARLWKAGVAPRIVTTRTRLHPAEDTLRALGVHLEEEHERLGRALAGLGVPADALTVLPTRADSTVSEASVIARWACGHDLRTLVVVTSPAHTRRARLILRRLLPAETEIAVVATPDDPFPAAAWWRDRRAAKYVLREWEKLAHYWLRERGRLAPCAGVTPGS